MRQRQDQLVLHEIDQGQVAFRTHPEQQRHLLAVRRDAHLFERAVLAEREVRQAVTRVHVPHVDAETVEVVIRIRVDQSVVLLHVDALVDVRPGHHVDRVLVDAQLGCSGALGAVVEVPHLDGRVALRARHDEVLDVRHGEREGVRVVQTDRLLHRAAVHVPDVQVPGHARQQIAAVVVERRAEQVDLVREAAAQHLAHVQQLRAQQVDVVHDQVAALHVQGHVVLVLRRDRHLPQLLPESGTVGGEHFREFLLRVKVDDDFAECLALRVEIEHLEEAIFCVAGVGVSAVRGDREHTGQVVGREDRLKTARLEIEHVRLRLLADQDVLLVWRDAARHEVLRPGEGAQHAYHLARLYVNDALLATQQVADAEHPPHIRRALADLVDELVRLHVEDAHRRVVLAAVTDQVAPVARLQQLRVVAEPLVRYVDRARALARRQIPESDRAVERDRDELVRALAEREVAHRLLVVLEYVAQHALGRLEALEHGHDGRVAQRLRVALLKQLANVAMDVVVGQQAPEQVEGEGVRVAVDVTAAQPQRVLEQRHLRVLHVLLRGEPEVGEHVVQRHRRDLRVQPVVVEEHLALQVGDAPAVDEVVRQLAQLAQVVAHLLLSLAGELQRLHRHLAVGLALRLRQAELLHLDGRVAERLLAPAAPRAEVVVHQHRVDVDAVRDVGQVPLVGDLDELAMVPVEDDGGVRLSLRDVRREFVVETRPEQRRDAPHRRQPVDEDVVEHLVVERQQVLEFRVAQSVLGRRQIRQCVRHEHVTVVPLDPLKQHVEDARDAVLQLRLHRRRVRLPAANLLEDEPCVQRQAALDQCPLDDALLRRGQRASTTLEPVVQDGLSHLRAERKHLDEVALVRDDVLQSVQDLGVLR